MVDEMAHLLKALQNGTWQNLTKWHLDKMGSWQIDIAPKFSATSEKKFCCEKKIFGGKKKFKIVTSLSFINLMSSNDHITIIKWSSYNQLMSILWLFYNN